MLLYPVYAVLFTDAGLSAAEISSLFVIWSVTSFALEVPSGLWADVFSRRRLLMIAPVLAAAGYALWTFLPCYASFAGGFVLWGAASALRSGTLQALVYEELVRLGAAGAYGRLTGRAQAIGMTAIMAASGLAAPVLAVGGYRAVGIVSVGTTLLGIPLAWSFPESRGRRGEREETFATVFRGGLAEVRRSSTVSRSLVLAAALTGIGALDEYVPLLARATGAGPAAVPLLVLLVSAGAMVGGWFAGRGTRRVAPALAVAAGCLAAGALNGRPAGLVFVAVAFGVFQWAMVAAETVLQDHLADQARATVVSMAGFGSEVVAVLTYAGYALGSVWAGPGTLFACAAVPYLIVALVLWRST
ncbi:MFS transporter [Actinomadura scrupuli]|uniref:MFS transporter n=1 Tax=Actinomadura scrupuli TaxID=559629 RepID=UPI003D953CB2